MAHFRTIRGIQASLPKKNKLLLVHCVSKQPLVVIPDGLPCVELEYREVHVRGSIHTQLATRNVNLTFVGVWVIFFDVLPVAK